MNPFAFTETCTIFTPPKVLAIHEPGSNAWGNKKESFDQQLPTKVFEFLTSSAINETSLLMHHLIIQNSSTNHNHTRATIVIIPTKT